MHIYIYSYIHRIIFVDILCKFETWLGQVSWRSRFLLCEVQGQFKHVIELLRAGPSLKADGGSSLGSALKSEDQSPETTRRFEEKLCTFQAKPRRSICCVSALEFKTWRSWKHASTITLPKSPNWWRRVGPDLGYIHRMYRLLPGQLGMHMYRQWEISSIFLMQDSSSMDDC